MDEQQKKEDPHWSAAVKEENRRVRIFRFLTDLTIQRLYQESMTQQEAWGAVDQLRAAAERFFPGKRDVFDLVIFPRLERVIAERFLLKFPFSAEIH
jgi:hypothetical protein